MPAGYTRPDPTTIIFAGTQSHRAGDAAKDFRFLNVLPEVLENTITEEKRVFVTKRDGTSEYSNPPATTGVGRGVYYWPESGKVYSVIGDKIYSNTTAIQTIGTSTGLVGFVETQGTNRLTVVTETEAWYINTSDAVTQIVDAQYPAAVAVYSINIDGYMLVVNTADGGIYNSDVDDPSAWTGDKITPEMYPDTTIAITKYRNMAVAFGASSVEFFYDAANVSGSPFSRAQQYSQEVGLAAVNTLRNVENDIFLVGQNSSGARAVYGLNNEKFEMISTEPLNRILDAEGTDITNADAMICVLAGRACYVLSLNTADRSFGYDIVNKQWFEISAAGGGKWDYVFSTQVGNGRSLLLHRTNGKIYTLSPAVYQDDGTNFTASITTNLIDFGTNRRKFITRLEVMGDEATSSTDLSIQWSDDDYKNFSTARTVDMSGHMFLRNCGTTRRRAFKLSHTDNTPLRLEKMEVEFDLAEH
jgi:hypothetical protein